MQQGSLEEGKLFVTVILKNGSKQLEEALLLDRGCNMDINLSDYKADQRDLPKPSKRPKTLETRHQQLGVVW